MFTILYEKRICKDLDKIPDHDVVKILALIRSLSSDPYPVRCKKLSGRLNLFRVRQGIYRIVYQVDHLQKKIRILIVGHRKDIYRSL